MSPMNKKIFIFLSFILLTSCAKVKTNTHNNRKGGHYVWTNDYKTFDEMINDEKSFISKIAYPEWVEKTKRIVFPLENAIFNEEYRYKRYYIKGICYCINYLGESFEIPHKEGEHCEYLRNRKLIVDYGNEELFTTLTYSMVGEISVETFVNLKWQSSNDGYKYRLENDKNEIVCEISFAKETQEESKTAFLNIVLDACRYDNLVDFGI